jgi:hypothetical protein
MRSVGRDVNGRRTAPGSVVVVYPYAAVQVSGRWRFAGEPDFFTNKVELVGSKMSVTVDIDHADSVTWDGGRIVVVVKL